MKILLVGTEPLTTFELTSALEDAGHAVVGPAPSPTVALCLVQAEPVDVAVLSVGSSGDDECTQLASILREQQGTASFLIHDASEPGDDAQGPDEAERSVVPVSVKPVQSLEDLLERLGVG